MATYQITGPDGGTYEITAPDNATPDAVLRYGKAMAPSANKQAPPQTAQVAPDSVGPLQAGFIGAGRTLDRLAAGLRSGVQSIPGIGMPIANALDALDKSGGVQTPSIDAATQQANTAAYAPLAKAHPLATFVGESAPLLAASSPLAMAGLGALEYGTPTERAINAGSGYVGGKIGQGLARAFGPETMRAAPSEVGDFVQSTANKWGIPTSVGQSTGNRLAQLAESVLAQIPFGGAVNKARGASFQGFNRAVSNTFGEDAAQITPEILGRALDNSGKNIGDIMGRAQAKLAPAQAGEIADLSRVIADLGPDGSVLDKKLGTLIEGMSNGQAMSGQTLRMMDSSLGRLIGSDVGDVRYAAARMQNILRDSATASLSKTDQEALTLARQQNFNVRQVADATKATPDSLSPSQLLTQVNNYQRKARYGGGNDLAELAQWGKATLPDKIPNSGTAQRLWMQKLLTGGGIGGALYGADKGGLMDMPAGAYALPLMPLLAGRYLAGRPAPDMIKNLLTRGGGLLGMSLADGQ